MNSSKLPASVNQCSFECPVPFSSVQVVDKHSILMGVARCDITPQALFGNWVDWKKPAPYPGIIDSLSVFALALENEGQRVLLIVCDTVDSRKGV